MAVTWPFQILFFENHFHKSTNTAQHQQNSPRGWRAGGHRQSLKLNKPARMQKNVINERQTTKPTKTYFLLLLDRSNCTKRACELKMPRGQQGLPLPCKLEVGRSSACLSCSLLPHGQGGEEAPPQHAWLAGTCIPAGASWDGEWVRRGEAQQRGGTRARMGVAECPALMCWHHTTEGRMQQHFITCLTLTGASHLGKCYFCLPRHFFSC